MCCVCPICPFTLPCTQRHSLLRLLIFPPLIHIDTVHPLLSPFLLSPLPSPLLSLTPPIPCHITDSFSCHPSSSHPESIYSIPPYYFPAFLPRPLPAIRPPGATDGLMDLLPCLMSYPNTSAHREQLRVQAWEQLCWSKASPDKLTST